MTVKDALECEKKSFHHEMKAFRLLPRTLFYVALISIPVIIILLFLLKKYCFFQEAGEVGKNLVLLLLLMISVSKDKVEDEMTIKLRGQAFVFAFIWGVIYTVSQPIVNFIFDFFLEQKEGVWNPLSVYKVLFSMLLIQIGFYWLAKRNR